jgi:hypothetical protein
MPAKVRSDTPAERGPFNGHVHLLCVDGSAAGGSSAGRSEDATSVEADGIGVVPETSGDLLEGVVVAQQLKHLAVAREQP